MNTKFFALAAIALVFCGAARAQEEGLDDSLGEFEVKGDWESIADLIDSKNGTGTLWEAVMAALKRGGLDDLAEALTSSNTTATVFAPTDEAFAELGADKLDALLADPIALGDIIRYHVIVGEALTLGDIKALDGELLTSALGAPTGDLKVRQGGKKAILMTTSNQTVPIYQYNMRAGSAIVHSIKKVLEAGSTVLTPTAAMMPTM